MNAKNILSTFSSTPLYIVALLCVCGPAIRAQEVTKVGTTAANFLAIDVGPRATAMGGAYVSVANDVTAMYWNPAGVARIHGFSAAFSNTRWIADISFNYAGAVLPLDEIGAIGINATFVSIDDIERTTAESPDGTDEFVGAGSYAFGVSFARNLTDQFSIGVNAKYINENMYHNTANGFALDVGALFDTHVNGLMVGMCISNYGTKMQMEGQDFQVQHDAYPSISGNNENINARFLTDRFDLPLMFRVGLSMDVLKGWGDSNLLLSVDALHPSDDVESVNTGVEYVFSNNLFLRGGYKGHFAKDSEEGFNVGGGLRYTLDGALTFHFDYSYTDFGIFSAVHTFSLGLEM